MVALAYLIVAFILSVGIHMRYKKYMRFFRWKITAKLNLKFLQINKQSKKEQQRVTKLNFVKNVGCEFYLKI